MPHNRNPCTNAPQEKAIAIIGCGAWGTAMALHFARNGEHVLLCCHTQDQANQLAAAHCNSRYLPGMDLPNSIVFCADTGMAFAHSRDIIIAVPSVAFVDVLVQNKHRFKNHRLAWLTKGLAESGHFLHEEVQMLLGTLPMAVISGPSFAREVALGLPTALTVASNDAAFADEMAKRLHSDTLRVYTSTDLTGVQLGGIVKNVLAIAAGISDGLKFGANARAALITRGMAELMRLGRALGAEPDTLVGLTCLGDLILTCTDDQSRNRRMGLALAEGLSLSQAKALIAQAVEGVDNVELVYRLALQHGVEMPITEQVYAVIQGRCTPMQAVQNLLQRRLKAE